MPISQEITVYANQNLTLSCRPRDSPSHLVFWYKTDRNNKDNEDFISTGPFYNVTKVTVNDTGIYSCSATEWGTWGVKSYILVTVIASGEQSCAHGWNLHKNACYMYSARSIKKTWLEANTYCSDSKAQLARVSNKSHDLHFIRDLVKNRTETSFWIAPPRGAHGNVRQHQSPNRGRQAIRCKALDKWKLTWKNADCETQLPFICQRVLPRVPVGVSIEHVTSFTARVGWTVAGSISSNSPQVYHVELTTSSGNAVSRTSSKERFVLFTHLRPNTRYQVRVQAENDAGNGSSSHFVGFRTQKSPPNIVSSAPNNKVIAGQSITLRCGHSHQNVSWYKEGSDVPLARGQKLTIHDASPKDEGTYYCAAGHGPRGSLKVLVIVPPVISNLKGIILKQPENGDEQNKRELILFCETTNRHPVEYAWIIDGRPLDSKTDTVKVSLEENAAPGKYECHVTNLAGSASKSLVIAPIGKTVDVNESGYRNNSTSKFLISIIAVLSVLLAVSCFFCVVMNRRPRFWTKINRKRTTQSSSTEMSPVELALSEDDDSPRVVPRSPVNVTRDNDDVFPYEVAGAWAGTSGPYMSLRRGGNNGDYEEDVTQVRKPDYFNISPSNRNDSAANCMYAPLKYTQGDNERKCRPYANVDNAEG